MYTVNKYIDQNLGKSSFYKKGGGEFQILGLILLKYKGKPETQITFLPQEGPILMYM